MGRIISSDKQKKARISLMSGGLNPDIVECQYTDKHTQKKKKKRKHEINYLPLQPGLFFSCRDAQTMHSAVLQEARP